METHMACHQIAYGIELFKPKDHLDQHLPAQMENQGCLLSTFLHERKHRVIKTMAQGRHGLQGYDKGIMEEVTVQHLHDIAHHKLFG
eukprot:8035224-Pyramimonas_sp.AAC.1